MNQKKSHSTLFLWLAIAGLLLFLFFFPLPKHTAFWRLLQDTGHFPLFGIISILLLRIFTHIFQTRFTSHYLRYFASLLSTLCLAALVELVQSFMPEREVSYSDFYLGFAGSLCFLLAYSLFDKHLSPSTTQLRKILIAASSISLALSGFFPLLALTANYVYKQQAFPTLLSFERSWYKSFLSIHENERLPGKPASATASTPPGYFRFTPEANAIWPFLRLDEVAADWSLYSSIQFTFISRAHEPLSVTILLDDQHVHGAGQHSQSHHRKLVPGFNRITVPLSPTTPATPVTAMDLTRMARIWIAFPKPRANSQPAAEVLIGEIRLH